MKVPTIWKRLLLENKKIIQSKDIRELANNIDKNDWNSLDYLQKHGYLIRILRGYYYVKSANERAKGALDHSIYEIISMALTVKGVNRWYFGLETALKLNNITHEYFTVNYVITDSYRTTKIIDIQGHKFKFLKWNAKHFQFGIEKKGKLRYSDKEKTVLDIAYRTYRNKTKGPSIFNLVREYSPFLDKDKLMKYFKNHYPVRFQQFGELL